MAIGHKDIAIRRRSKVSGPFPFTPCLPSVISTAPVGLNLKTWWPLVMPFGPLADSPSTVSLALASLAHTFPSASTVKPWGNANVPPPKLVRRFPEVSNFKIGGSERPTQVPAPAGSVLKQR